MFECCSSIEAVSVPPVQALCGQHSGSGALYCPCLLLCSLLQTRTIVKNIVASSVVGTTKYSFSMWKEFRVSGRVHRPAHFYSTPPNPCHLGFLFVSCFNKMSVPLATSMATGNQYEISAGPALCWLCALCSVSALGTVNQHGSSNYDKKFSSKQIWNISV